MSTVRKITLKSSDGENFEIDEAVALESQTIKHMIEDDCTDNGIPLPNVTSKILSKVIEYCKRHVPTSALDAATYGLGLLMESRLRTDIERYAREVELIVLPAPDTTGIQPTSFERSAHLIGEALAGARTTLAPVASGRHLRLAT